MDLSQIVNIIGSLGFPIFACCAMGYFVFVTQQKFTDAINQNNDLIRSLINRIDNDKNK